jgi:hypothetical protein
MSRATRSVDGKKRFTLRVEFRIGVGAMCDAVARMTWTIRTSSDDGAEWRRHVSSLTRREVLALAREHRFHYGVCDDDMFDDVDERDGKVLERTVHRLFPELLD